MYVNICFTLKKDKKMYQLQVCPNIDLQWYLGGGKLAFLVNKVKM